jgi:hypothetical protein
MRAAAQCSNCSHARRCPQVKSGKRARTGYSYMSTLLATVRLMWGPSQRRRRDVRGVRSPSPRTRNDRSGPRSAGFEMSSIAPAVPATADLIMPFLPLLRPASALTLRHPVVQRTSKTYGSSGRGQLQAFRNQRNPFRISCPTANSTFSMRFSAGPTGDGGEGPGHGGARGPGHGGPPAIYPRPGKALSLRGRSGDRTSCPTLIPSPVPPRCVDRRNPEPPAMSAWTVRAAARDLALPPPDGRRLVRELRPTV